MNSPCQDCEERKYKCHSTCPDYIEFRQKRDEICNKRYAERDPRQIPTLGKKSLKYIYKGMMRK